MNFIRLFLLLRRNIRLGERRHPMFEQNRAAKVFAFIGIGFWTIYFIGIGTMLGWSSKGGNGDMIFAFMPFILIIDFLIRLGMQQTPAMLIKPYILLPIARDRVIDTFLVNSIFSEMNLFWLPLVLPYSFIAWCGGLPGMETIGMLLLIMLMIIVNSQWYLLVRTLVNHHIWWWALPAAVYLLIFSYPIINLEKGMDFLLDGCMDHGLTWYTAVVTIALGTGLFLGNRRLQRKFVSEEISKVEKTKMKHVSQFTFLNKFGEVGEYLKLEVKSTMRNKAIRQRFIQGVLLIIMLSSILAFTDVYNGKFSTNIWCLYCFLFFGAVNLVKLMGPEGNYIDLLMVHQNNIYTLLKAKYYFYCMVLALPLLILLAPIFTGKFSVLMVLAYLFTTSGTNYFLLFQLAVYNKQSLPLNEKVTGKGNFENTLQLVIEAVVFIVPTFIATVLSLFLGDTIAYTILLVVGILFTVSHPIWLRNIYQRMMTRKYQNMEGFHATR
jgi:hypothetical protein